MNIRSSAEEKLEQATRLPAQSHGFALRAAEILAVTVAVTAAFVAFGRIGTAWLAGIGGCAAVAGFITYRVIKVRRMNAVLEFGSEAQLMLGWRSPAWNRVEVRKWKGLYEADRVRLFYAPGLAVPALLIGQLTQLAQRRLGGAWTLRKHNQSQSWVELEQTAKPDAEVEKPDEVLRAEKVATQLFGDSASTKTTSDEVGLATVEISFTMNYRLTAARVRDGLEKMVSAVLPNRWKAEWDLENDRVVFRRRPDFPKMFPHPAPAPRAGTALETYKTFRVPYGIDEDGNIMSWVPRRNPHHIVTGTSGSGKTVTMLGMLLEFAHAGWQVFVNDAKLIEFLGVRDWPNVVLVAKNTEEQTRILHYAHEVMEQRYAMIVSGRASVDEFEPMIYFLDEFADYREELTDWYSEVKVKGDPARPPVLRRVRSVARKGRTARVHFCLGLQRPDAEFLTGEVRDNFSARTSLGRLSPQGAQMMWENAYTGVSLPRTAIGRGMTMNDNGEPVEFQSFWTPDPSLVEEGSSDWEIVQSLFPEVTEHERLMIEEPTSEVIGEGDDAVSIVTYSQIAAARIRKFDAKLAGEAPRPKPRSIVSPPPVEPAALTPAPSPTMTEVLDEELEEFEGYKEPQDVRLSELEPGMLLLVDESAGVWGAVEELVPDLLEDGETVIDYRDFSTGNPAAISLDPTSTVTVRTFAGE